MEFNGFVHLLKWNHVFDLYFPLYYYIFPLSEGYYDT
jgi:hypothetical protein